MQFKDNYIKDESNPNSGSGAYDLIVIGAGSAGIAATNMKKGLR